MDDVKFAFDTTFVGLLAMLIISAVIFTLVKESWQRTSDKMKHVLDPLDAEVKTTILTVAGVVLVSLSYLIGSLIFPLADGWFNGHLIGESFGGNPFVERPISIVYWLVSVPVGDHGNGKFKKELSKAESKITEVVNEATEVKCKVGGSKALNEADEANKTLNEANEVLTEAIKTLAKASEVVNEADKANKGVDETEFANKVSEAISESEFAKAKVKEANAQIDKAKARAKVDDAVTQLAEAEVKEKEVGTKAKIVGNELAEAEERIRVKEELDKAKEELDKAKVKFEKTETKFDKGKDKGKDKDNNKVEDKITHAGNFLDRKSFIINDDEIVYQTYQTYYCDKKFYDISEIGKSPLKTKVESLDGISFDCLNDRLVVRSKTNKRIPKRKQLNIIKSLYNYQKFYVYTNNSDGRDLLISVRSQIIVVRGVTFVLNLALIGLLVLLLWFSVSYYLENRYLLKGAFDSFIKAINGHLQGRWPFGQIKETKSDTESPKYPNSDTPVPSNVSELSQLVLKLSPMRRLVTITLFIWVLFSMSVYGLVRMEIEYNKHVLGLYHTLVEDKEEKSP